MDIFLQNALAFPTLIFSFLLSLMMVYWFFAALGAVEVDVLDIEGDSALEGDGLQAEGLAGLLLKLGLGGVPITIVLTLLAMFSWVISYLIESLLLSYLPLGWLRYPLGLVVAVGVVRGCPSGGCVVQTLAQTIPKVRGTGLSVIFGADCSCTQFPCDPESGRGDPGGRRCRADSEGAGRRIEGFQARRSCGAAGVSGGRKRLPGSQRGRI